MSEEEYVKKFHDFVNPQNVPDGHCAMCSFNTYLGLSGFPIIEASDPQSDNFKIFGDWFYNKFVIQEIGRLTMITNGDNENISEFKEKVELGILEYTHPGEGVIICMNDSEHWLNAYNLDGKIIFIDSQKNLGFNVYTKKLYPNTTFDIIRVPPEIITEYFKDIVVKYVKSIINDKKEVENELENEVEKSLSKLKKSKTKKSKTKKSKTKKSKKSKK